MTCWKASFGQDIEGKSVVVIMDDKDEEADEVFKKAPKEKCGSKRH
jgi:hypothetical protein